MALPNCLTTSYPQPLSASANTVNIGTRYQKVSCKRKSIPLLQCGSFPVIRETYRISHRLYPTRSNITLIRKMTHGIVLPTAFHVPCARWGGNVSHACILRGHRQFFAHGIPWPAGVASRPMPVPSDVNGKRGSLTLVISRTSR